MPHFVLDLSRLITSAGRPAPTGIDRVEIAYAREFLARAADQVSFSAMTRWGRFGKLDRTLVKAFIESLTAQWYAGGTRREASRIAARLCREVWLDTERNLHTGLRRRKQPIIYLNVSHHHLERPASILRLKAKSGAFFVPFVHDLIPIEFPEYARPNQDEIHHRRVATVTHHADAIVVNSKATANVLAPKLVAADRNPPVVVAPLGIDLPSGSPFEKIQIPKPYFICIGTIEPRKNHLLLLAIWRQLAMERGLSVPHLVIVGRRGWENENVVDLLERCPALRGKIHEFSSLTDIEVCAILRDAKALLLPSFAEGYGLPLIEALALGVPALCSDIPALREVGGDAPEFLDPLDGPAWREAVLDYARPDSARRASQCARIAKQPIPDWRVHFTRIDDLMSDLIARQSNGAMV